MGVLDKIKDLLSGAFNHTQKNNNKITINFLLDEDDFVYDGECSFNEEGALEFGMLTPFDDGKSMWLPGSTTSPDVIEKIQSAKAGDTFKILKEKPAGPLGTDIKNLEAIDNVKFEIQKVNPFSNGLMPYLLTRQI